MRRAREKPWGRPVFSFDQRQIFASQIFIHRGKFLRDFSKSGKPPFDCTQMFEVYRLVQAFDPSFAAQYIDAAWVDAFTTIPPLAGHVAALKRELPAYLSKCAGATFDHTDVAEFTKGVLLWWANNGKDFPTWALAMQIVGSFTPNSAAAERVFSMLKQMFGDMQMTALADMIQAALMLKYNGRKVG